MARCHIANVLAAGICQAAQETYGDPETAMGYELDAIAMVVIGGTSLSGGRGGVDLTLIGAPAGRGAVSVSPALS